MSETESESIRQLTGAEKRAIGRGVWQTLREQPRTAKELHDKHTVLTPAVKSYVERIKIYSGNSAAPSRGKWTIVYHLMGDERRGIHRFYLENQDQIEACWDADYSLLNEGLDDYQLRLLAEERYALLKERKQG